MIGPRAITRVIRATLLATIVNGSRSLLLSASIDALDNPLTTLVLMVAEQANAALVARFDAALYEAKSAGKSTYRFSGILSEA